MKKTIVKYYELIKKFYEFKGTSQNRLTLPASTVDWPSDAEALLEFGPNPNVSYNWWCLKDAFEGVQIFGSPGSGKSSGSGQAIARSYLQANMGGVVLTVKTDECLTWRRWAQAAGREQDLIIVEPGGKYRFNFLNHELKRSGAGAGLTDNIASLFSTVAEAGERKAGQGGNQDPFWSRTQKEMVKNAIDLCVIGMEDFDLPSIQKIITSAPHSIAEVRDPAWQKESACFQLLQRAEANAKKKGRENDYELTCDYWLRRFPGLCDETRSIIETSFTSMADCFLRGILRDMCCTDTTFTPEDTFDGKIIILNVPVKEFNETGIFFQCLFKHCWQRAVERRIPQNIDRNETERTIRPVFLYADEAQFFAGMGDCSFQSTARSSRACTVYLTQNLPSYVSAFGGPNARTDVEAFLGNMVTKIFHANSDPTTNSFAAETIGKTKQRQGYGGYSEGHGGPSGAVNSNQNAGSSAGFQYLVQPQEFTMLATGGQESDYEVEAIIFQGGRRWIATENGRAVQKNFIKHQFNQNI